MYHEIEPNLFQNYLKGINLNEITTKSFYLKTIARDLFFYDENDILNTLRIYKIIYNRQKY